MVGPLILLYLLLVKNIVSDDIITSQVIRTETLVISSKRSSLNKEKPELVNSLSSSPNTTQSSFLHENNKYSKSNEVEIQIAAKDGKPGKHSKTSDNASKNESSLLHRVNASDLLSNGNNDIPEPVENASVDVLPIKLNNYTYTISNTTKGLENSILNATSEQNPDKPAKPAGTTADNPNTAVIDRSAFVGDLCATGYVKVNGKCVQPE
ncbi:unnamed protein product, partial [Brenthis ino]